MVREQSLCTKHYAKGLTTAQRGRYVTGILLLQLRKLRHGWVVMTQPGGRRGAVCRLAQAKKWAKVLLCKLGGLAQERILSCCNMA